MKNAGVFLGGLGSVLACNLMLIGVCSSAPTDPPPAPAAPPPPPPLAAVVKFIPEPVVERPSDPMPMGLFMWGCGGHLMLDPEGALPLPVCLPIR
ncbi:MAG: hypothetical protein HY293_18310 [Planctomycetes bacterium]|nr:hypothetical protein [Planctomycetota bacterium]